MKDSTNNTRFFLLAGLIILAALTRLIDHPANISPIMAIAIFGGALFDNKKIAFVAPLVAMFLSDLFLGFSMISIFVYSGFVIGIFIGFLLKRNIKVRNIIIASLSGSVVFFLLTNLGSWMIDPMYQPLSVESLMRSYTLAIPFFRNSVLGDIVYVAVLFGSYSLATRFLPLAKAETK